MRIIDTSIRKPPGISTQENADHWSRKRKRCGILVVLALCLPTTASAQAELATEALTGLVKGFTGQAGSDLWGWMIGGGQSAGTSAISSELSDIESTLENIETDLTQIQGELEKIACGFDTDFIDTEAGAIQDYYETYANWLTDMCNADANGTCQNNGTLPDLDDVSEWANCAVGFPTAGQTCQDDNILTLLNQLNDAATAVAGADGSIADCIIAAGSVPATNTLDDRPYYTDVVQPITDWYLLINTQAMSVLTEAYHFRAWQAAGKPSSGSADDIYDNVCSTDSTPDGCVEPITVYQNDFLEFTKGQLEAGGAPYSTDDYLMINFSDFLVAISIEAYNAAAGADCPDPVTTLCGPTVGAAGFTMGSVALGPYDYGTGGNGTWEATSYQTLNALFATGFNQSHNLQVNAGEFLCTMSLTGGDLETCTQPNGGAGLKNVVNKGIYFPETLDNLVVNDGDANWHTGRSVQCFLDGNLTNAAAADGLDQPICNNSRFSKILRQSNATDDCTSDFADGLVNIAVLQDQPMPSGASSASTGFPNYYNANYCLGSDEWTTTPGYMLPLAYPKSFQWPSLDLAKLTCSDGSSAADAKNPAGVPTLCGSDFDAWFNTVVPSGPTASVTQSLNATALQTGDTLSSSFTVKNDIPHSDFYIGGIMPDGNTMFFVTALYPITLTEGFLGDPTTFRPLAKPADVIPIGDKIHLPGLYSYTFHGLEPIGNYQMFSALSWSEAFADGNIDEGDIISLDIETVNFEGDGKQLSFQ